MISYRYRRYRIDIDSHMYTTEVNRSSLICTRHFFIFYWYWQYYINIYHFIILKYHHLYAIRDSCCFTLTISYRDRFSYVHSWSCPYLTSISYWYQFAYVHFVISSMTYLYILSISTISISSYNSWVTSFQMDVVLHWCRYRRYFVDIDSPMLTTEAVRA